MKSVLFDFLFGSLRAILTTEMVDVELTVRIFKGIYMHRKEHTVEFMVFIPWSKKVTPFPSLRCKIQAYNDNQGYEKVLQWGNTFQFSAPSVTQTNTRKRVPGKRRARWSNKARYNPMKMKRPNTPDLPVPNMDTMDSEKTKVPLSVKV